MKRIERIRLLKDMKIEFLEKFIQETRRIKNLHCNSIARQTHLLYADNIMKLHECFVKDLQKLFDE